MARGSEGYLAVWSHVYALAPGGHVTAPAVRLALVEIAASTVHRALERAERAGLLARARHRDRDGCWVWTRQALPDPICVQVMVDRGADESAARAVLLGLEAEGVLVARFFRSEAFA